MIDSDLLSHHFYAQPTLTVAERLLGQRLVRLVDGQRLVGVIAETEAYVGFDDSASHASKGRTTRTEVMFGPAGCSYVYLIYGMYNMFNIVTEQTDVPAAVLIRAVEPTEGIAVMQRHRRQPPNATPQRLLTNGPGKLSQAFAIDRSLNRWDLTAGRDLWIEAAAAPSPASISTGPRIGIDYADANDRSAPWRFWMTGNRFVSK